MKAQILIVSLLVFGVASAVWAENAAKVEPAKATEAASTTAKDEPIKPIEAATPKDAGLVELGKKLYFDPTPVQIRFHFLQLLPQPEHGWYG